MFDGSVVDVVDGQLPRRALNEQDGLFTLVDAGNGRRRDARVPRSSRSVSRALAARDEWDEVLRLRGDPRLELIFSNTTEVGIALDEADAATAPSSTSPRSFPAKLAAFLLLGRAVRDSTPSRAPVVIPTELIEHNGDTLRELVVTLARRWNVEPRVPDRGSTHVPFCNTLVDRIVPGAPSEEYAADARRCSLRRRDDDGLRAVRLFAIEGDETLRDRFGFAGADAGVIVARHRGRIGSAKFAC